MRLNTFGVTQGGKVIVVVLVGRRLWGIGGLARATGLGLSEGSLFLVD
jgi:hypothetical protein